MTEYSTKGIDAEMKRRRTSKRPFEERLATPEGERLKAEVDGVLQNAINIVKSNEEAMGFCFAEAPETKTKYVIPLMWRSDEEKDYVLTTIRMIIVAYKIESYVMINEGWAVHPKHHEDDIPPSQNPHRIEVLNAMGMSENLSIGKVLEIDVDENGNRFLKPLSFADKEIEQPEYFEVGGRLAELLPPKSFKISDEQREAIKALIPGDIKELSKSFFN